MGVANKKYLVWLLAAVSLAGQAPPPATAEARFRRELRRAIQSVVRASRERFRPMQGARIDMRPGNEYWFDARHPMPEATDCRVYEHPPSYTCRWEKSPQRPDLAAFYGVLSADVEAILGDAWKRVGQGGKKARYEEVRGSGATLEVELTGTAVRVTVAGGDRPISP